MEPNKKKGGEHNKEKQNLKDMVLHQLQALRPAPNASPE